MFFLLYAALKILAIAEAMPAFFALPKEKITAQNLGSLLLTNSLKNIKMENILIFALPGGMELVIILFVVLLLFGGRKIPELMRGVGKGIREFNNARATIEGEIKEGMKEADREKAKQQESDKSMGIERN